MQEMLGYDLSPAARTYTPVYNLLPFFTWVGIAGILVIFFFPSPACSESEICGSPAAGRVAVLRGKETVATFFVTVAESDEQRRRGLMKCPELKPGTGMLFTSDAIVPHTFWMKDTTIELAIIFIASDNRISAIEHGIPYSLNHMASPGPVRFILEINYAEARTLQIGDQVSLLPFQSNQ